MPYGYIPKGWMRNKRTNRASSKISRAYRAYKKRPGRSRYYQKKRSSFFLNRGEKTQVKHIAQRAIKMNGELRYCPQLLWDGGIPTDAPPNINQADRVPVPIPNTGTGSSAYMLGFETGITLGTESTALNASMPPDVGAQDAITPIYMYNLPAFNDAASAGRDPGTMRNGEYMYAHSQKVKIQINMAQARDVTSVYLPYNVPVSFRVLVVKRKPRSVIAGDAGVDFRTELFRNYDNNVTGLLNAKSVYQLKDWKVNKLALNTYHDFSFKLSPPINPVAGSGGQTNNNSSRNSFNSFPQTKDLNIWLPKPGRGHKIKWNGSADADPRDSFNYKVQIFIMAYYPNGGAAGTFTPAPAKFWTAKVYTESKFREP